MNHLFSSDVDGPVLVWPAEDLDQVSGLRTVVKLRETKNPNVSSSVTFGLKEIKLNEEKKGYAANSMMINLAAS